MSTCCEHLEFDASVEVNRVQINPEEPVTWFSVVVLVRCKSCMAQMRVVDPELPAGLLAGRVTVDVLGTELRVPMWPVGEGEPPVGLHAGFTIERQQ